MADKKQSGLGEKQPQKKNEPVAVAISSQGQDTLPPIVVAAGRGHLAEQILELAFSNGVRVREDSDLAQILASVDIDSEIPLEAFSIVAEILTYLYRVNGTYTPRPDGTFDRGMRVDPSNWNNKSKN
ncbi:MAG: hypothetical protein CFH06_00130 [Alphaproteobacteria bacterium MarineAlpha3_Bin5]|nr:flagellar protein FhlB [Magnetovibrio sp.]PPR80073.1 MAG: hypothetical protein CFH06_00130 [Alphaproteobacteria bacterium MarineAlpha3_Bin5]